MPNWDSIESVSSVYKILSYVGLTSGILAATFGIIGSFAGVGSYFFGTRKDELSSIRAEAELERIRSVVHNMTGQIVVEFSWPQGNDPLIPVDQGQVQGDEVQLEFEERDQWHGVGNATLVFRRTALYEIQRTSSTSATFIANVFISPESFPIGRQKSDLRAMRFARIIVPIKGYWMNGRDQYQLSINRASLAIKINGGTKTIALPNVDAISPSRIYDNVIWGYLLKSFELPSGETLGD